MLTPCKNITNRSHREQNRIKIVILIIGLLYIFLPSINHSGDTYAFATDVRDGRDLFLPHHLLYNAFYYGWAQLLNIRDPLRLMCIGNALFAMGCLFFADAILSGIEQKTRLLLLIFLGFSFGFLRYATTGETYIVPLFFSLWSSYLALKQKNVVLTGFVAASACLFHQVHVFWWLGLLYFVWVVSKGKRNQVFWLYMAASCIVPVVYVLAFYLTDNDSSSFFEWIIHDYVHQSDVEFAFKPKALLLTPINFVRTFCQVHGYIVVLLQKYWALILAAGVSAVCAVFALWRLKKIRKSLNNNAFECHYAQAHGIIFLLQLLFAFFSYGNAEFMVMLPFALVIFVFFRYRLQNLPLTALAVSLVTWNLFFALLPFHFLELMPSPAIARYISKHSEPVYFLTDRQTVNNSLNYYFPDNQAQLYALKKSDKLKLDSLLQLNTVVMSDLQTKQLLSRATFTSEFSQWKSDYEIQTQDSVPYDMGTVIISRFLTGEK